MTTITISGRSGATFSGMEDALLISDFPTSNFSTETGSQNYPFLLRPDLTGIPSGATVTDAFWTINVVTGGGSSGTISVRRSLRNWVEAQATWNIWSTGNSWTTAGAGSDGNDRAATESCNCDYPGGFATGDYTSDTNTQLITDIQNYVDGSLGELSWLFLPGGFSVALPANGTAATRPQLTVVYTEGGGSSAPAAYANQQNQAQ